MFAFEADCAYAHMPFASPASDGSWGEFCCIMVGGVWKLHGRMDGEWKRIETGLPHDAMECSPVAEWNPDAEDWRLSFVAGGWDGYRPLRLFHMEGVDAVPQPLMHADVGFVWKQRMVHAARRGPIFIEEPGRTIVLEIPPAEFLYRVSCNPMQPNQLLVSGQFGDGTLFSWAYQVGVGTLREVLADGVPAYKCALVGDECYHAERLGGFEERRIIKADRLEMPILSAAGRVRETVRRTYRRMPDMEFE